MLPTKKQQQKIGLDGLIVYLYGPPKIGKTTFALNLETKQKDVFFLDSEGGTQRLISETYAEQVRDWPVFVDFVKALHSENHNFGVVVVDSVTELREHLVRHVCELRRAQDTSDPKFGGRAGWGKVASSWKNALNLLMAGPWATVFVDHATQVETDMAGNRLVDPDKWKGPKKLTYFPTLSEKARFIIAKRSDLMIRAYKDENGNRIATCTELDGMGGQRGDVLPDVFPLDGEAFVGFFRAAYKKRSQDGDA